MYRLLPLCLSTLGPPFITLFLYITEPAEVITSFIRKFSCFCPVWGMNWTKKTVERGKWRDDIKLCFGYVSICIFNVFFFFSFVHVQSQLINLWWHGGLCKKYCAVFSEMFAMCQEQCHTLQGKLLYKVSTLTNFIVFCCFPILQVLCVKVFMLRA